MKYASYQPAIGHLAIVERVDAGTKNSDSPAVRSEMVDKRIFAEKRNNPVVFRDDRLGLGSRSRKMVGDDTWDVAICDIAQNLQPFGHSPVRARIRARAASGESTLPGFFATLSTRF